MILMHWIFKNNTNNGLKFKHNGYSLLRDTIGSNAAARRAG